jgi:hypothetical protein
VNIEIRTIPHNFQRYDTAGDWYEERNVKKIMVSDCRDKRYEYLLAIHELVEMALCDINEVAQEQVDAFDLGYKGEGESGDDPEAPYGDEHCIATSVERMLCAVMGVKWKEYDDFLESL